MEALALIVLLTVPSRELQELLETPIGALAEGLGLVSLTGEDLITKSSAGGVARDERTGLWTLKQTGEPLFQLASTRVDTGEIKKAIATIATYAKDPARDGV